MEHSNRRILFDKDPAVIQKCRLTLLYSRKYSGWFWGRQVGTGCKKPVCKEYSCEVIPTKINQYCPQCYLRHALYDRYAQVFIDSIPPEPSFEEPAMIFDFSALYPIVMMAQVVSPDMIETEIEIDLNVPVGVQDD
jgi:hypothetical protein